MIKKMRKERSTVSAKHNAKRTGLFKASDITPPTLRRLTSAVGD